MNRPLRVTLLAWGLAGLALWHAVRLLEALLYWRILGEYSARPGALYLALTGALWTGSASAAAYGLLRGRPWARPAACGCILAYTLWYWLDRLLAQVHRPGGLFALGATMVSLSLAAFILLSGPSIHFFRRELHDRESETPSAS